MLKRRGGKLSILLFLIPSIVLTSCSIDAPFQVAVVNGHRYLVSKSCRPAPVRRIEIYDTPDAASKPGPLIWVVESNQNGPISYLNLDSPATPFSIVEGGIDLNIDRIELVVFQADGTKYDQIFFSRSRTKAGWTGGGPGQEYKLSNYAATCIPPGGSQ